MEKAILRYPPLVGLSFRFAHFPTIAYISKDAISAEIVEIFDFLPNTKRMDIRTVGFRRRDILSPQIVGFPEAAGIFHEIRKWSPNMSTRCLRILNSIGRLMSEVLPIGVAFT